ncbi:MAG: hypothetical protein K2L18_07335 [Acetatifactor sp.]|nr:hypothetical protein [Acetatifactor sp.]
MAFYNICSKCGATLDPGERCDCEEIRAKEQNKRERLLKKEKGTNQYVFNWDAVKEII